MAYGKQGKGWFMGNKVKGGLWETRVAYEKQGKGWLMGNKVKGGLWETR